MEKFGWLGFFIVVYQKKLPTKGILFNERNPTCENYNILQLYYNTDITGQPGDGG